MMEDIESKFAETYPSKATATVVSTTHQRKKEDIASRTLQRHWREHKKAKLVRRVARAQLMRDAGRQVRSEHDRVVEELLCSVEKNKPPSGITWGSQTSLHESTINLSRSTLCMKTLPLNATVSVENIMLANDRFPIFIILLIFINYNYKHF